MKKILFFKKMIAPIVITSAQVAILLAVLFFVFQILQNWLSALNSQSTNTNNYVFISWVVPSIFSISVGVFLISLFIVHNHKKNPNKTSPAELLAFAILNYAEQLRKEGRDSALVSLRNNFSITLHILGFHDIRIKLGKIALQAATIIKDTPSKTEILIDDLGWANYLINQKEIAQKNIERGIFIADEHVKKDSKNKERLSLCIAKGARHLAIIDTVNYQSYFNKAENILKSLEEQSKRIVQIEYGQIYHAKALGNAIRLNINKNGSSIRPNNDDDLKIVKESLLLVEKAANIFSEYDDLDRYAKALALHVRLLESIGEIIEALEISALRDRTLAVSEWIRTEGTNTLIGK